ncbi:MAG: carbon monoxide dehydrogenase subunit G [Alphaproteobacteria bacterium]|nr:carbon monoxide dehydrogenase subunit G [Alphaproteobacteria bacterium]MDP6872919.1 carbon monoxide dehydrogenase subunit G [Alphaproteobacteria bacterium]
MDLSGEYRIAASRERVWAALNDPEVLKASIPGCSALEAVGGDSFTATVTAKVGPVKAKFQGQVTLSDMDPPNGYTIQGEGKGGAAGFAKGGAKVTLLEDGDGTLLQYEVNANVGGKLAQIGSRLIDGTAKKLAGEFFTVFAELAAEPAPEAAAEAAPAPEAGRPGAATEVPPALVDAAGAAGEAAPEMLHVRSGDIAPGGGDAEPAGGKPEQGGLPRWVWLGGLIVIMIVIIGLLGGD